MQAYVIIHALYIIIQHIIRTHGERGGKNLQKPSMRHIFLKRAVEDVHVLCVIC